MLGSIHGVLGVGSSGGPGGWGSIGGGDGVGGEEGDGGTGGGGGGGGEGCGTSPDEASSMTSMPPPEDGSWVRRRSGTAVIGLGLGSGSGLGLAVMGSVMGSATPRAGRAQPLTSVTAVEMQPSELKARASSSQ